MVDEVAAGFLACPVGMDGISATSTIARVPIFLADSALVWTGDHWIACFSGRQIAPRIRGNAN